MRLHRTVLSSGPETLGTPTSLPTRFPPGFHPVPARLGGWGTRTTVLGLLGINAAGQALRALALLRSLRSQPQESQGATRRCVASGQQVRLAYGHDWTALRAVPPAAVIP